MKNDDVPLMGTPDFSLAVYEKLDLTDTSFTFTIPDDDWYTLVIENPGTETVTVDYEYTDWWTKDLDELSDEVEGIFARGCLFCGLVIGGALLLIAGVIILIIVLVKKSKNKKKNM
ncbi:MAG: hypothetical protein U9R75_05650 [Candidatus Thermoplasmatota archaeon]|nr:hypothetical protein [Candidatus Thermoplasmatota archaeon]